MKFLNYFKNRISTTSNTTNTAKIAKERLQIIVAHQRKLKQKDMKPQYIVQLQKEILAVIKKYIHVSQQDIKIEFGNISNCSLLELNVLIPDKEYNNNISG